MGEMHEAAPAPTTSGERHNFVDALRGVALLGILIVNIEFIVAHGDIGWMDRDEPIDLIVRWASGTFALLKIYPLFALLYGYGLSLQVNKATELGEDLSGRYRRRMLGLALLGIIHGVFFFPGDILVIYAIVGVIAFRSRHLETEQLLRRAKWLYGIATVIWLVLGVLGGIGGFEVVPFVDPNELSTLASGSWIEINSIQRVAFIETFFGLLLFQGPPALASVYAGTALGRTDMLSKPTAHVDLAKRALRWAPLGFLVAGFASWLLLLGGAWFGLGIALALASAPIVSASYIAILSLTIGGKSTALGSTLQMSGRMSLTNYLFQSVIASTIAFGYGFGQFNQIGPLGGIVLAVVIWLVLSGFSMLWMQNFRFGPLEWLLRSWTYRSRQPLRRA